jgi:hypothetical protein
LTIPFRIGRSITVAMHGGHAGPVSSFAPSAEERARFRLVAAIRAKRERRASSS